MNTGKFKDEDVNKNGVNWGNNGNAAKLHVSKICSDNNYQQIDIKDEGNWQFSANCSIPVSAGWSKPYSDQHAKLLNFGNRDLAAEADCKTKGFATATNQGFNWRGYQNVQLPCFNPKQKGSWIDKGCKNFEEKRFETQVETGGVMDWGLAAEYYRDKVVGTTLNNQKILKKESWKDLLGGWVGVQVSDPSCNPKGSGDWIQDSTVPCPDVNVKRWSIKIDNVGINDLDGAAATFIKLNNLVVGQKWKNKDIIKVDTIKIGNEIWVTIDVNGEEECKPIYDLVGTWADDGCKDVNIRKKSRKLKTVTKDVLKEAQWFVDNVATKPGQEFDGGKITKTGYEDKGSKGLWSWFQKEDSSCLPQKLGDWEDDPLLPCPEIQVKRLRVQIDDRGINNLEEAATQYVKLNNLAVGQKFKDLVIEKVNIVKGDESVIWVIIDLKTDKECVPTTSKIWKDEGCQESNIRKKSKMINTVTKNLLKEEKEAQWILENDFPKVGEEFSGGKVTAVNYAGTGSELVAWYKNEDSSCKKEEASNTGMIVGIVICIILILIILFLILKSQKIL